MGTELGNPTLPLGCNADAESRLVARAGPWSAKNFSRFPDRSCARLLPHLRLSLATYATHDHKPVRAMWEDAFEQETTETEQARQDLARIAHFAGVPAPEAGQEFDRDFYGPALEALFRCESWVALVMITDLLARKDRFNVPGTAASSNWSRRMSKTAADLKKSPRVRQRMQLIHSLLEKTGRIGHG